MKFSLFVLAVSLALPVAVQAQQRPSPERLIEILTERGTCGDFPVVSASYVNQTENRVTYTCGADAQGIAPALGLLGLGGAGTAAAAIALGAAAAGGGGGSTPDTQ